jgi:hypothetical protein
VNDFMVTYLNDCFSCASEQLRCQGCTQSKGQKSLG